MSWQSGDVINTTLRMQRLSGAIPTTYTVFKHPTSGEYYAETNVAGGSDDHDDNIETLLGRIVASNRRIFIREGTMAETDFTVPLTSLTNLLIEGTGPATILEVTGLLEQPIFALSNCTNCTIRNIHFKGAGAAAAWGGAGGTATDTDAVTITGTSTDNLIANNYIEKMEYGISLNGVNVKRNHISGNTVTNCYKAGILLQNASSENVVTNNHVQACGCSVEGYGIHVSNAYRNTISANVLSDMVRWSGIALFGAWYNVVDANIIRNNYEGGLYLSGGGNYCIHNVISNNLIEYNYGRAMQLYGAVSDKVGHNIIVGNSCGGNSYGTAQAVITLAGYSWENIVANNVVNADGHATAIQLYGGATGTEPVEFNIVSNNLIRNFKTDGIYLGHSVHHNTVRGNTIYTITTTPTGAGIGLVYNSDDNLIQGNYIYGNSLLPNGITIAGGGADSCDNETIIDNIISGCTANNINELAPTTTGSTNIIRNNVGFNPIGIIANPFDTPHTCIEQTGAAATPTASTDYLICTTDIIISSTDSGNNNNAILIKDPGGNVINPSALSTLDAYHIPLGYKINWGAYTGAAPTVVVSFS